MKAENWKAVQGEIFANVTAKDGLVTTTTKGGSWITLDAKNAFVLAWLIFKYAAVAIFQKRLP